MVIGGKKYIQLFDFYTSKNTNNFPLDKELYKYTFCISNCVMSSIENRIVQEDVFYTYGFFMGKASENFILYDKVNKKVLTQIDMQEIFRGRKDFSYDLTINLENMTRFLKEREIIIDNKNNAASTYLRVMIDTSIFSANSYSEEQYSTIFNNIYACRQLFPTFNKGGSELNKSVWCDLIGTGVDLCNTNTDCKIANSLFLKNCMLNGKITPHIDNTVFAVDWTVYIDGTYNPTIKITWDSEYMNFDEIGNTFDASKVFIGYGSENPFNVDWESGSYTTSYKEVVKVLYPSIYEKIIEGVGSLLDAPSFSIRLLGATLNGGVQVNSGTCFFVISSKGTVSESGLAEGSEGLSDTITIVYGNDETGGSDEDSDEPSENDNPSEGEEISVKGFNLLTLTYALTPNRLAQLGSFIWGASFLTNLKLVNNNPIENIVSCKMFPFTVTGGADTSIKLGNVETGINGNPVSSGGYSAKKVINGFTISPLFNNFMDYEPYTKISVFLPFIGIKELQPSQIMNKALSLEYVVDIVTGICKCIVKSGGKQIADYDGSMGIDIPITSSNRAQVELSYITSALGVVGSIAMGSPLGVVGSVLSGASSSYHSETKGTSSPTTGVYGALTPFVIFDRPKYTLPSAYGKTKGFVCNKTCTISSLSGFTVCHENVKLNGISCTNEELEEIKSLLTSGFFA